MGSGRIQMRATNTDEACFAPTCVIPPEQPRAFESEAMKQLEADMAFARSQEEPCFINTGCRSFSDGSCTGIEIVSGDARLVRWRMMEDRPQREVLDSAPLAQLLADVAPEGRPISIP